MSDDTNNAMPNSGATLAQEHANSDQADKNGKGSNAIDHADPTELIKVHAAKAITDAGGNAALLLPHIVNQLGWRKDGDEITIFSSSGEGDENIKSLVQALRRDNRYRAAFQANQTLDEDHQENADASLVQMPRSNKSGSGSGQTAPFTTQSVKSTDPLALGYALRDIASGKTRVNFNN